MNLKLAASDLAKIRKLYEQGRRLENLQEGAPNKVDSQAFLQEMRDLKTSSNEALQKCATLAERIQNPTAKQLTHLLVPLERLLDRSLRDDQMLISVQDRQAPTESTTHRMIFVLDHLRSGFNVGSIFRLADCLRAHAIYLCGYTATPDQSSVQATSLGASESVRWQHVATLQDALIELRNKNYKLVALETAERATSLYATPLPSSIAWIVGNERFGLDHATLNFCDEVRYIPTLGSKNSLNVANTLSIAGYEWLRQQN